MLLKNHAFAVSLLAVLVRCCAADAAPQPVAKAGQVEGSADKQAELDERLFDAVKKQPMDVAAVEAALKAGAKVNAKKGIVGWTPLYVAARDGHAEVVTVLLNAGAEVNAKANAGRTPLHSAADEGHAEAASVLLKAGAEVNAKESMYDRTPLHVAAGRGHAEVVTLLLKAGAALEAKDIFASTPLHFAAECGHAEVVTVLLKAGANPRATDGTGRTPHAVAKDEKCRDLLWNAMMGTPLE